MPPGTAPARQATARPHPPAAPPRPADPVEPHRPGTADDGAISVFVAIVMASLVLLIGLVVDGAGRMRTSARADALAQEAARAAGQSIDYARAVQGDGYVVDRSAATRAALDYLAAAGADGNVGWTNGDRTVVVDTTLDYHTTVAALFGASTLPVHGHGSATLVVGVRSPEESP